MKTTSFIQAVEFMEGGIAPTLGSCNFAKTKFTVEIKKLDKKDFENAKKNK